MAAVLCLLTLGLEAFGPSFGVRLAHDFAIGIALVGGGTVALYALLFWGVNWVLKRRKR